MGLYTSTFVAYAITVFLVAVALFGLLALDGAVPLDSGRGAREHGLHMAAVFATTIVITFVPWIVWRHLQAIEKRPNYAAPVGALTGLALSDMYLIAVSAMGFSDPVDSQLVFMLGAGVIGALSGPIYVAVEAWLRRPRGLSSEA